ncbi:unnamed protein product [Hydatigera taeniaeformis]|uniref:RMI1_N domain-containing protein n=1 Tax=Hydatigena taeniaeformis TaxID=6205 RepID=A0A0R3WPC9_HYDTA|nr:unnamed protein product [Hydatigera taeniaeformis]
MRTDVTTLEAYHQEQVVQGNREQPDLESEEGTAIPQSISHAVAKTDIGSYSANGKLNIPCAPKKLPELEAFSSGIQPFEPYKNLPNSQGAYNRVRNTLRRAKRDPDVFRRFGVPTEENTQEFPVMDGLAPRSELHEERHGWRQSVAMESCLNSSSGVENRLRRSNKGEVDNQACDIDDRHHYRRHFRKEKLYFVENKVSIVLIMVLEMNVIHCGTSPSAVDIRGVPMVHKGAILVIQRGDILIIEPVNPPPSAPRAGLRAQAVHTLSAKAPLTVDDINVFLAHSDGESSDSSDWNDVKEEAEEEEGVESCGTRTGAICTGSTPSVFAQTVGDVSVTRLLPSSLTNIELINSQSNENENGSIPFLSTQRLGQGKYELGIRDSSPKVVSEVQEKRLEMEFGQVICGSEQVTNIEPQVSLTETQQKALQICESKRANALTMLGSSRMSSSSCSLSLKNDEIFVAAPTNIRVMRPQISSHLWATRTRNRRVLSLSQYVREAKESSAPSVKTEATVLVGVIGSKTPPHRSQNSKIFSIWRLTDLVSVGTGALNSCKVSLFLFGAVHEKLWKEQEGTVVAILKPKLLPPREVNLWIRFCVLR